MTVLQQELHVASIDVALVVRVFDLSAGAAEGPNYDPFDLSPYFPGNVKIRFKKPDDTVVEVVAVPTTVEELEGWVGDGTDGYAEYRTPDANFLDQAGFWEWQVVIDDPTPQTFYSQIVKRKVFANL
jgi:hypothetical protein